MDDLPLYESLLTDPGTMAERRWDVIHAFPGVTNGPVERHLSQERIRHAGGTRHRVCGANPALQPLASGPPPLTEGGHGVTPSAFRALRAPRRGLLRLDLAEVTPAHGTRRSSSRPARRRRRTPCIARTASLRAYRAIGSAKEGRVEG